MNIIRIIAWLEGISFLLFGISMPLKYGFDIPEPNYFIGMGHGILFILYNLLIIGIFKKKEMENQANYVSVLFITYSIWNILRRL